MKFKEMPVRTITQFTPVSGYFAVYENPEGGERWEEPVIGICIVDNEVSFQCMSGDGIIEDPLAYNESLNITIVSDQADQSWQRCISNTSHATRSNRRVAHDAWMYHNCIGDIGKERNKQEAKDHDGIQGLGGE